LCNTGLARARRKLLAGISFEDALRDARNVKICPTFQRQRYKAQKRSDSLESHVNVLKCLLVHQFTNLIMDGE
jgi:hypothetical protein